MTKDRILFSTSSSRVMAQAVDGSSASISRRLSGVKGDAGKVNDVYVLGQVKDCKRHVIFFGGDVQDYPENMEKHRDNRRYKEWSTEATAAKVLGKFPQSLVFVVKPSRMHLLTFAVYSNFVETSDFGNPSHSCDFGAVKHLSGLYSSAVGEVYDAEGADGPSDDTPVSVVGFSKGCVVLNQIVFELPSVEKDSCLQRFLSKITEFHWLDGGHSGGPDNTWVTDEAPLRCLAGLDVDIRIHVTPYQVRDPMRKWIGQQQVKFYKKLKSFEARVTSSEHFDVEPPSLDNHFRVLEEF